MPRLLIVGEDGSERTVELTERTLQIGRGPGNDIVLADASQGVSRTHAELRFRNGRCVIVDLQSQNGTWLNGQRVQHAEVPPDSEITVGTYRMRVRLDRLPTFVRPALGLVAIDVADVAAAVVVSVDANGPAAAAKVQPGDLIVGAGGQPVADASALAKLVTDHTAGSPITLELRDAKGTTRKADVSVFLAPRLIGVSEQGVLVNRLLVHLRARLAAATDPFEQSVIRLNTAVALGRIGDWNAARKQLKQVQLPDRPGVGNGTVQYLLGVAAQELGNRAEAETAFKAAAATESLLTEDGPPVKELAEQRLAQLPRGN